ncbi:MAG: UbiA family prenyltransferase [Gammaproteobacteria bacterium]|nr:UbiA family prenyltransferase [Gammaproteobacteria bacterium]
MSDSSLKNRWWIYQRERFPIIAHAPLVAAFSFSALCFSSLLRGDLQLPGLMNIGVAFFTALFFFMQLRIADEFKDIDEDTRYRPYRPVPRGLVTLKELGTLGIILALLQLSMAVGLKPGLALWLLIVWIYFALMSREFFLREWLKARPITYLWSHMLIMPLIDLYATACDWYVAGTWLPEGLYWFLLVSFFNGIVIEIGRKLRAPEDEEEGVDTYTVIWGRKRAVMAWLLALVTTAACALVAAALIGFTSVVAVVLLVLLLVAVGISWRFIRHPVSQHAKWFELVSGIWTLLMYLTLGAVPLLWQVLV